MSKISIILMIFFGLIIGFSILAQETNTETNQETNTEENVTAEDLEIKDPTLLPDSPFYFIKNWTRGIRSFFNFGKMKDLELESEYANERLMEIKKMIEQNKDPKKVRKATEKYERTLERVRLRSEKMEQKAGDDPKIKSFLEKYTNQQILHQKILEKLENQVSPEAFEKIQEARQEHLDKFEDVMNKLENKEQAKEKIEKALKKMKKEKDNNNEEIEEE